MKHDRISLKPHLVNLLYEDYQQTCLYKEFSKLGLDIGHLLSDNHLIVLAIIGFPVNDNILFHRSLRARIISREDAQPPIPEFTDDWLSDRFSTLADQLYNETRVVVTNDTLITKHGTETDIVLEKLGEHVDWLYEEFDHLDDEPDDDAH